jgi:hypothetical protein
MTEIAELTETEVTEATEKGVTRGAAENKEQRRRRSISCGSVLKYSPLLFDLRSSALRLFAVASVTSVISVSVPSVTSAS